MIISSHSSMPVSHKSFCCLSTSNCSGLSCGAPVAVFSVELDELSELELSNCELLRSELPRPESGVSSTVRES